MSKFDWFAFDWSGVGGWAHGHLGWHPEECKMKSEYWGRFVIPGEDKANLVCDADRSPYPRLVGKYLSGLSRSVFSGKYIFGVLWINQFYYD